MDMLFGDAMETDRLLQKLVFTICEKRDFLFSLSGIGCSSNLNACFIPKQGRNYRLGEPEATDDKEATIAIVSGSFNPFFYDIIDNFLNS